MCDYSLYTTHNRLAEEGEELVLHRFETGTLGFASVADVTKHRQAPTPVRGKFWPVLQKLLSIRVHTDVPAVCIPPGTRLLLNQVPRAAQESLWMRPSEVVVFTEVSSRSYSFRDALVLANGARVLLQDLPEGIHATVLSTSPESSEDLVKARVRVRAA